MNVCCYNGRFWPDSHWPLSVLNAAFRHGDSLIETMRWQDGKILFWEQHMDRLRAGLRLLKWSGNCSESLFFDCILQLIEKNNILKMAHVRLQVFPENDRLGFLLEAMPLTLKSKPLTVGIASQVRKNADGFSALKTGSRFVYNRAREEAMQHGWDDALLLNNESRIVESTVANIFWTRESVNYTPPLSEGCVAGVMRRQLLSGAVLLNRFPVVERALPIDELRHADALYLVSALRGVREITTLQLGER